MKKIITFLFPFILVPLMGCNSYSPVGTFINFEEISNTSILTKEEVINLAYNVSINHVVYDKDRNIYEYPNSIIKSIENLDNKLSKTIIKDYFNSEYFEFYKNHDTNPAKLQDIRIKAYCGFYHDYYAILFDQPNNWFCVGRIKDKTYLYDDVLFVYPSVCTPDLLFWKAN